MQLVLLSIEFQVCLESLCFFRSFLHVCVYACFFVYFVRWLLLFLSKLKNEDNMKKVYRKSAEFVSIEGDMPLSTILSELHLFINTLHFKSCANIMIKWE